MTIHRKLNPEGQRAYSLMEETESNPDTISGLGLNWGETKALCAVQRLLDYTNHLGHAQTRIVEGQLGKFKLPVLFVKITDYLSADELEKNANNRFNNNQRTEALRNIESLEKQRKIFFEKSYWQPAKGKKNQSEKKGQWISNFVEIKVQLIAVKKMYSKPSKSSTKQEENNQKKKRYTYLQIICSPLLFYRINKEYLLKPEGLFRAIEDVSKKANNKAKKSSYNLIVFLL